MALIIQNVVLPETGYVRLSTVLAVFPISKSTWWAGIKEGRYPPPIKLGPRAIAWKSCDIRALIEDPDRGFGGADIMRREDYITGVAEQINFRQSGVQVPLAEISNLLTEALGRDNETNRKLQTMLGHLSHEIAKLGNLQQSSTIERSRFLEEQNRRGMVDVNRRKQ